MCHAIFWASIMDNLQPNLQSFSARVVVNLMVWIGVSPGAMAIWPTSLVLVVISD
jgi:hypothetical protein